MSLPLGFYFKLPFFKKINHVCRLISQGYGTCAITQTAPMCFCMCMCLHDCLLVLLHLPIYLQTRQQMPTKSQTGTRILKNSKFSPFHGNVQPGWRDEIPKFVLLAFFPTDSADGLRSTSPAHSVWAQQSTNHCWGRSALALLLLTASPQALFVTSCSLPCQLFALC